MSRNTDSNQYTILFAIGMVVIVGSLLAFTASSLKPNIAENERMEKQQNILMLWVSTKTVRPILFLWAPIKLPQNFLNTFQNN